MVAIGKMDIGKKRSRNEDAFFVSTQAYGPLPNIYIVADGMGGHKGGAYASKAAIDFLRDFLQDHQEMSIESPDDMALFLKRSMMHANYQLFKKSKTDSAFQGMGTTLTICTVQDHTLYAAHVGDSRLYTVSHDTINQITNDHSLVQEMIAKGYISDEEASDHPQRHIITRAVGTYEKIQVDTYTLDLEDVEYIFLCTDGITTMLSDEEIHTIITSHETLETKVDQLIKQANDRGGKDNITVILSIDDEAVKKC